MIGDPAFYAVAVPAILIAGISKSGFAGGAGIFTVPMIALAVPPLQAAGILLPILCVMDAFGVWAYRRHWDHANMRVMLPAGLAGVVLATLTASLVSEHVLRVGLGIIAVAFALNHLAGASAQARCPDRAKGSFWSALAGYASFLAHAGGPPLNMYLLPQRLDKAIFVGTTVVFWAVINVAKIGPYAWLGQLAPSNLTTSLALAPLAPLGIWIGLKVQRRVPAAWFFRIVYGLTLVVGVKLLWDGVARW